MTKYIDLAAARAFVEANYQGDPLLRHLYGTLLDKLPTVPNSSPMFLLKSAPADADILKTLASSPVIYSTGEETIIPLMPDRWIPVTERLPKYFEQVLVHVPGDKPFTTVHEVHLRKDGLWDRGLYRYDKEDVTHWMPLPEPPKEV